MSDDRSGKKQEAKVRRITIQDVVEGLRLLMVLQRTHGTEHELTEDAARKLVGLLKNVDVPLTLRFIGKAIFHKGRLLPLDAKGLEQGRELGQALHNMAAHELAFDAIPTMDMLLRLGRALAGGDAGKRDSMDGLSLEGISWRALPGLKPDGSLAPLDLEVKVSDLLALATADAEYLVSHRTDPWNLVRGLSVVRRLARCRQASAYAALRVLEVAPGDWTVARRAVAAAYRALSGLTALGMDQDIVRPVVHATLACCCHGLRQRDGLALAKAADSALKAVLEGISQREGIVAPHHVRACAVLHRLRTARTMSLLGPRVTGLVHLAYEMERRRCPASEPYDLSFAELLARGVESGSNTYNEVWVRLIASAFGEVPVGTVVRLADGSVGIIMGPGDDDDPLLPRVQVGGRVVLAKEPVELFSATAFGVVVNN